MHCRRFQLLYGKSFSSIISGNAFNDWFNGRELNPRWRLFDLKYVCFRSGIIGWMLLNFINMSKAFETKEGPTLTLLLVTGFQLLYVVDYFWFEDGLLVTRDIVHEYLGYNLLVQFLMIPFCFAVQTRYLMMTGHTLPWYCLLTITILNSKLFIQESSTKTLIKESQKSLKLKFILAILFKPFGFLDTNHF